MFYIHFKTIMIIIFGMVLGGLFAYTNTIKYKRREVDKIKKAFKFDRAMLDQKIKYLKQNSDKLTYELAEAKKYHSININRISKLSIDKSSLEQVVSNIPKLKAEINRQKISRKRVIKDNTELEKKVVKLTAIIKSERKYLSDQTTILNEIKNNLLNSFRNIVSSTLKEEGTKLSDYNKIHIGAIIDPVREQLIEFKKKVEDVYDKESKDRYLLLNEIGSLKSLNERINKDAINLTKALKGDIKVQGCWGELVLERILEISGLQKGHAYNLQVKLKQPFDNKYYRPDAIVRLPKGRDVIIDSKVSLKNYEIYCSSSSKSEKDIALRKHIKSIKLHIKNLASKKYNDLEGLRSLDFVLMFVPIEEAFFIAVREETSIILESFKSNVFIVSPSTLLITLKTINNIWKDSNQNKNSVEIARQAGEMYDKFTSFVDSMNEIGKQLTKATNSYMLAKNRLVSGRGNLIKRAQNLKDLGLKTKKELPQSLIDDRQ